MRPGPACRVHSLWGGHLGATWESCPHSPYGLSLSCILHLRVWPRSRLMGPFPLLLLENLCSEKFAREEEESWNAKGGGM